jgi:NAD dependent epimerase/dehydratase family enzyme
MKTAVYQGAYKLALDYNEAIQTFSSIKKTADQVSFDFDKILAKALAGKPVKLKHLTKQAKNFIASRIAIHASLANFRIARARKDRYLLSGYYTELLPQIYFSSLRHLGADQKY